MIPGSTGLVTPRPGEVGDQVDPLGGVEEELGHGEVGAVQLVGQVAPVLVEAGRLGVPLGVRRDADGEVPDLTRQVHQVRGVGEFAGAVGSDDGVPTQGHQIDHARVAVARQDLAHLGAGVTHAHHVSHRGQVARPLNLFHQLEGALAVLAPAAVGDRHEGGRERLEVAQGRREHGGLLVVLGRKNSKDRVSPAARS